MGNDHEDEIVHRQLDTGREDPAAEIAEIVAELDGRDVEELATTWAVIDDAVAEVFSNPPAPEAQVQITFSYEGYRITVEQDGTAKFVAIE